MLALEKAKELKELREDIEKEKELYDKVKIQPYNCFEKNFTEGKDAWKILERKVLNKNHTYELGDVLEILCNLKYAYINRKEFTEKIKPYLDWIEKDIKEREEQAQKLLEELEEIYTKFFEENAGAFYFIFKSDKVKELIMQFLFC